MSANKTGGRPQDYAKQAFIDSVSEVKYWDGGGESVVKRVRESVSEVLAIITPWLSSVEINACS
jgi:hypothetical protein